MPLSSTVPLSLTICHEYEFVPSVSFNTPNVRTRTRLLAWVVENAEIKAMVEQRIRYVPPENRERAFITAAKSLALNQTVQSRGVTP